ncbi:hypothetical protein JAAARDRAFT_378522 [Jaapia argillacea MUCL 33604]|uniref:F-box domain-containing protein n=1 Tax=Jaapia argillacea MUCL 33604 TaxID=933084 RepID=A0A067QLG7_9AGAM|nr:hypothetical protein JAAARDRAFT_378522 [Jaapia argillacea MUCL 33604]
METQSDVQERARISPTSGQRAALELSSLPTELIIRILEKLDVPTLLICLRISKSINALITTSATLLYQIELYASSAVSTSSLSCSLPTSTRLSLLKAHQKAWAELIYESSSVLPPFKGSLWELAGGALATTGNRFAESGGKGNRLLTVRRLPSVLRGIEEKVWDIRFEFEMKDFTIDPAQDLLVAVEESPPSSSNAFLLIHLLSLSTGSLHPLALAHRSPILCSTHAQGQDDGHQERHQAQSYNIQVSGDYVGVLFLGRDVHANNELWIWDWKRAVLQLRLSGPEVHCYAFLSSRHIIVGALWRPDHPAIGRPDLLVFDFKASQASTSSPSAGDPEGHVPPTSLTKARYVAQFSCPAMSRHSFLLEIVIRSDPPPNWRPPPDVGVPFYTNCNSPLHASEEDRDLNVEGDRVFTITLLTTEGVAVLPFILFVPARTFLTYIHRFAHPNPSFRIPWSDWGPSGTRMIPGLSHSLTWTCYTYGCKVALPYERGSALYYEMVKVYDFNQHAIRRGVGEMEKWLEGEGALLGYGKKVMKKRRSWPGGWGGKDEVEEGEGWKGGIGRDGMEYVLRPSDANGNEVFEEPVITSLPYRTRTLDLTPEEKFDPPVGGIPGLLIRSRGRGLGPFLRGGRARVGVTGPRRFNAVMLSEDNIITVRNDQEATRFEILTF